MSDQHAGLPVAGYRPQPTAAVDTVNANKRLEEQCLRCLDALAQDQGTDKRSLAIGRTQLETAWMWINRSIFKPSRVTLPDDPSPDPPATDQTQPAT